MSAEQKPKLGAIAIDVEKLGRRKVGTDPLFAVGIATAPVDATSMDQVKSFSVALDLKKPTDHSWSSFWAVNDFESRCWVEFWSKNQAILDLLQDPTKVSMVGKRAEVAAWIDETLKKCEEMYERTVIVTDTTLFDTVCVGSELVRFDYIPLNFNRDGSYRGAGGIEVDSFISGLFGVDDASDWRTLVDFTQKYIDPLLLGQVKHDHHPENDAKSILLKYLAAVAYSKNNRKRLRRED